MAEVVVFHHAHGLTDGVLAFADDLRDAGHRVFTPDLYDGATFDRLPEGIEHAEEVGFDEIVSRGVTATCDLGAGLVYVGFSLGVMPARRLVQTRPGARGAVFISGCVPPDHFGVPWPAGVPLQIHVMEDDDLGDVDVARQFVEATDTARLFLYPGDRHLFADRSLPGYEPDSAALLTARVLEFLAARL